MSKTANQFGCKMWTAILLCKILYMQYIFALRAIKITILEPKVVIFLHVVKYTKFANFTGLYFTHFPKFLTHSKMLFLAVVLDFVLLDRSTLSL